MGQVRLKKYVFTYDIVLYNIVVLPTQVDAADHKLTTSLQAIEERAENAEHYSLSRVVIKIASFVFVIKKPTCRTCDFYNYPAETVMFF